MGCLGLGPGWLSALSGSRPSQSIEMDRARDSSGWEQIPLLRAAKQEHIPRDWGVGGWLGLPCLLLSPVTLEGILGWREKRREK